MPPPPSAILGLNYPFDSQFNNLINRCYELLHVKCWCAVTWRRSGAGFPRLLSRTLPLSVKFVWLSCFVILGLEYPGLLFDQWWSKSNKVGWGKGGKRGEFPIFCPVANGFLSLVYIFLYIFIYFYIFVYTKWNIEKNHKIIFWQKKRQTASKMYQRCIKGENKKS